jgi:hypothetical protein
MLRREMLELFRTPRNLRIVAGGLGFLGMLYGLTAVLCLVRRDYSHALISGLALVVMVGLGLAAWLKSASRSIPEWLRAGCFVLALALFFAVFR